MTQTSKKNYKKKKNFKKKKSLYGHTDGRTDNPKLQFGTSQKIIKVKKLQKKKNFYFIRQTDGQTDTLSTQNYSSEPHKNSQKQPETSDYLSQTKHNSNGA